MFIPHFKLDQGSFIRVISNLQIRISQVENACADGLRTGAVNIMHDAMRMTPIQQGSGLLFRGYSIEELESLSQLTVRIKNDAVAENGWSHPWKTHENPNTGNANYPRASTIGQPEFFKNAFEENEHELITLVSAKGRAAVG